MFKSILKDAVNTLFQNPKIIRLSFLTLVFYSIVRIYFIIYYFNTFLIYKYESGVTLSDAFLYILEKLNNRNLRWILGLVAIVILWYLRLHPIWDAAIISALENPQQSGFKSFLKGSGKFFPMLEYWGLSIPFGLFTFSTAILRLYLMDIFDSVFMDIVVGIWAIMVLFASICRSYAKIIIALEWGQIFDAIKKSTSLALNNLWLSIKLMFVEVLLLLRFILIGFLILGIPLGMIYIAVWFESINNPIVESTIRIISALLLLVLSYINCIAEAFFLTYRYKAYKTISQKE